MKSDIYKELGLTKRQVGIAHKIVTGQDLGEILNDNRVSVVKFHIWLSDKRFEEYLETCIKYSFLQARLLIAGYAATAAAKLIGLLESDKPETARKACLDILKGPVIYSGEKEETNGKAEPEKKAPTVSFGNQVLDGPIASKILQEIADERA